MNAINGIVPWYAIFWAVWSRAACWPLPKDVTVIVRPLEKLQIILRIDGCCDHGTKESFPFTSTIHHLAQQGIPFQIFCGPGNYSRTLPHYQATKMTQNRVAWLVFVEIPNLSPKVSLSNILDSCCIYWRGHRQSEPVNKDLIYLMTDISTVPAWPSKKGYEFDLIRCRIPAFLIFLFWNRRTQGISEGSPIFALDSCYKTDGVHHVIPMQSYFHDPGVSIDSVFKYVQTKKADFKGSELTIFPSRIHFLSVSEWQQVMTGSTLRKAHGSKIVAFGMVLSTLAHSHNFTFKTTQPASRDSEPRCRDGFVSMFINAGCSRPQKECYAQSLTLVKFRDWRTFYVSNPSMSCTLCVSDVIKPFSTGVFGAIIAFTMSTTLIYMLKMRSNDVVGNLLLVTCSLCSQISRGTLSEKINGWHTGVLLLAGLIAAMYTTVLQSTSIVPSVHESSLTLDDMIEQNFRFFTYAFEYLTFMHSSKRASSRKSIEHVPRERLIADRLVPLPDADDNLRWIADELSQDKKQVLLVIEEQLGLYSVLKDAMNKDVISGRERIFAFPGWWTFEGAEKGELLRGTVEWMKAHGLLDYFLSVGEAIFLKENKEEAKQYFDRTSGEDVGSLADGVFRDAFVLCAYGLIISIVAFVVEYATLCVTKLLSRG